MSWIDKYTDPSDYIGRIETNESEYLESINNYNANNNDLKNLKSISEKLLDISTDISNDINGILIGINNLKNVKNGSEIMITDSKSEYNYLYYKNMQIFIGIIAIMTMSAKIFRR